MRPVCLIIRDGYGYNPNPQGNAVWQAHTPVEDRLLSRYPHTILDCCGEAVGLPEGYQGSSEVGHLNMGAGRVVIQELKRIDDGLANGSLFRSPKWDNLVRAWKQSGGALHLLGLLQDEGVHAHQEHLFKIMRRARADHPTGRIWVHPFLDGRDTPPRSCLEYLATLQRVLAEVGHAGLGTAMGRYYGMDRGRAWPLTDQAFRCLVQAEGRMVAEVEAAVQQSYDQDRKPDGSEMADEYVPPLVVKGYPGIADGDVVFHTNYRQDRAIQLTQAFVSEAYPGTRPRRPRITYLGLTRYYDEFTDYLLSAGGGEGEQPMNNLLGEVLSRTGLRQLRIAETQKFRHVTSFFNGKATTPYALEDQVEVKGRFDPASFAQHPEMEAYRVVDELLARLGPDPQRYPFIAVNFANCDMVGHTGVLEAAVQACTIVDECLGRLVEPMLAWGYQLLITADHGNSDQMVDYATGRVKTSHSLNPVRCLHVSEEAPLRRLVPRGKLADLAVTVLDLLGLPVPPEMTATSLLVR